MNIREYALKVDMYDDLLSRTVTTSALFVKGDENSSFLNVDFLENGTALDLSDYLVTATVQEGKNPNTELPTIIEEAKEGRLKLAIPTSLVDEVGANYICFRLYKDGKTRVSAMYKYYVINALDVGVIGTEEESSFLASLIKKIQELIGIVEGDSTKKGLLKDVEDLKEITTKLVNDIKDFCTQDQLDKIKEDLEILIDNNSKDIKLRAFKSEVYTRDYIDRLLTFKADVFDLDDKADKTDVYTKDEVFNKSEVYNKQGVENLLINKANASDVYTKSQTYDRSTVNSLLTNKADKSEVYAKSEADAINIIQNNAILEVKDVSDRNREDIDAILSGQGGHSESSDEVVDARTNYEGIKRANLKLSMDDNVKYVLREINNPNPYQVEMYDGDYIDGTPDNTDIPIYNVKGRTITNYYNGIDKAEGLTAGKEYYNTSTKRTFTASATSMTITNADNLMILEGDWTDKDIPAYFTGIKSIADEGYISILTNDTNLYDGTHVDGQSECKANDEWTYSDEYINNGDAIEDLIEGDASYISVEGNTLKQFISDIGKGHLVGGLDRPLINVEGKVITVFNNTDKPIIFDRSTTQDGNTYANGYTIQPKQRFVDTMTAGHWFRYVAFNSNLGWGDGYIAKKGEVMIFEGDVPIEQIPLEAFEGLQGVGYDSSGNHKLEYKSLSADNVYEPYKESTLTIPIPTELHKVGNVSDNLYYDNSIKILKKTFKYVVNPNDVISVSSSSSDGIYRTLVRIDNQNSDYSARTPIISDKFIFEQNNIIHKEGIGFAHPTGLFLYTPSTVTTVEQAKQWFTKNTTTVVYPTKTPTIHDTGITDKLTSHGYTRFFVNSNVPPSSIRVSTTSVEDRTGYIMVMSNTPYNISYNGKSVYRDVVFYDANKTPIGAEATVSSFNTPANCWFIRILGMDTALLQVSEGNEVFPYETYRYKTYTIPSVPLRSNADGTIYDELANGKLIQRIDENGNVLSKEIQTTVNNILLSSFASRNHIWFMNEITPDKPFTAEYIASSGQIVANNINQIKTLRTDVDRTSNLAFQNLITNINQEIQLAAVDIALNKHEDDITAIKDDITAINEDLSGVHNVLLSQQERITELENAVNGYIPMFAYMLDAIVNNQTGLINIQNDFSSIEEIVSGHVVDRLKAVEERLGITPPSTDPNDKPQRPVITWKHESWQETSPTIWFETSDIPFGIEQHYNLSKAGLRESSGANNGVGGTYYQYNYGYANTIICVYKSDIPGFSDALSNTVKINLFNSWFVSRVDWIG